MNIFSFFNIENNSFDWTSLESYDWFQAMRQCEQDKLHHAEGNVETHTKMVCELLIKDEYFSKLNDNEKQIAAITALLHDVAKSVCSTINDEGRIESRNHCSIGAVMAREILYKQNLDFHTREIICNVIKYHLKPFFLIDYDNPMRLALQIAASTRLDLLALNARCDIRGRLCQDAQKILDNIELFLQFCQEASLFENPLPYTNAQSRFEYFRNMELKIPYEAYDNRRCEVILMSGLPGSGKDHWIKNNAPDWPIISLDEIRRQHKIKPTENQRMVASLAHEAAKEYMRKKQNFIFNATNLTRQLRGEVIDKFASYNAYIKIVYVETNYDNWKKQNQNREYSVAEIAMNKMLSKLEVPDLTEAHEVEFFIK